MKHSGQEPFVFAYRDDAHTLPGRAAEFESKLHGGFAVDKRPGFGSVYYGMPGCGLLRVRPDLKTQDLIELDPGLTPVNFHSTKIAEFDGKMRLILPANDNAMVVVLSLEGDVDFILPAPEFEEYRQEGNEFHPTDAVLDDTSLFVADGYGANYVSIADLRSRRWTRLFGGSMHHPHGHGKFGTAHGMNRTPEGNRLAIADRPHARVEMFSFSGQFSESFPMPADSRPCGIDFMKHGDRWYGAVGSLDDPQEGRPAPIYIVDAQTYAVVSTIRPKEELGVEKADHIHNVVWHEHSGTIFLVCQSWNPGFYFVLEMNA